MNLADAILHGTGDCPTVFPYQHECGAEQCFASTFGCGTCSYRITKDDIGDIANPNGMGGTGELDGQFGKLVRCFRPTDSPDNQLIAAALDDTTTRRSGVVFNNTC